MNLPRIIGIDFGTTFTACALREPSGAIIELPPGAPIPSRALKTSEGADVFELEAHHPVETGTLILNPKRIVFAHRESRSTLRWNPGQRVPTTRFRPEEEINDVEQIQEKWTITHQIHFRDPELRRENLELAELGTLAILRRLRKTVEAYLLGPLSPDYQYVLGVPAQSYAYGYALKMLAQKAGWPFDDNNVRMLAEPYAVLLEALGSTPTPGRYLVIDAGGGTTDWAVVDVARQSEARFVFHLLNTRSDAVGGSDIDVRLWERFRDRLGKTPAEWARLRIEREKVNLSKMGPGSRTRLAFDGQSPMVLQWSDLAAVTREVFSHCLEEGRRALGDPPDHIIVSGGASLSPEFLDLVKETFQKPIRPLSEETIPYACARGLTRVLDTPVHGGMEQDLAWVEYPSQRRTVWVQAFNQNPGGAPTKTFRFAQTPGIIPLFLGHGENWAPAGYLKVSRTVETITPVWVDQRLEFRNADRKRVAWVVEPIPLLRVGTAMAFQNNRFKPTYQDQGQGFVTRIRHSRDGDLEEWVGNPEDVTVEISPDGNALVPVVASVQDWIPLDLTGNETLSPRDFPRLPRRPWKAITYVPFGEEDGPLSPVEAEPPHQALVPQAEPAEVRDLIQPPPPRIRSADYVRRLRHRIDHLTSLVNALKTLW